MDKKTIGIVVKNDYNDILYYENNFFIKIDINKKDDLHYYFDDYDYYNNYKDFQYYDKKDDYYDHNYYERGE